MIAVGVWFYAKSTRRFLYLMRNNKKQQNCWGLPGGKIEYQESLMDTMVRECVEEIGHFPDYIKLVPVEKFSVPKNGFEYHTFLCVIEDEFIPELNIEHTGYAWLDNNTIPKPLHPGLWNILQIDSIHDKINTVLELIN